MSNIIDSTAVKAQLVGKTISDADAQALADAVNEYIEGRTHRFWGGTTTATERYDFMAPLYLRHMDVASIESIKLGYPGQTQQVLDPSGYWANTDGRVTMYFAVSSGYSVRNNDLLEIAYTYGVTTVPADLERAALSLVTRLYNYAINGGADVVSSRSGSYSVETIQAIRGTTNAGPNVANNTNELMFGVIDRYAMKRL